WPGVPKAVLSTVFYRCHYAAERLPAAVTAGIPVPPTESEARGPFKNPFVYCAAIGTINHQDERYTGPARPDVIVTKLRKILNVDPAVSQQEFALSVTWRCLEHTVVACARTDQAPCSDKAGLAVLNTQLPQVVQYCADHPQAAVVPNPFGLHDNIYELRCTQG